MAAATMPALVAAHRASTDSRPWVEKYRPSELNGIVSHEEIISTLKRLVENNNLPHLLLYGPPGTGKTTTIHALARLVFGGKTKGHVLEMNASDDRGIDIIRNQVKDFASTGQVFGGGAGKSSLKLVILDEADQMTSEAQAALRRVIEKYTRNVRFCIVCNHVNRIIPAVQSRCTRFRLGPVKKKVMLPRLGVIANTEKVGKFTDEGLAAAFKLSNGDMRRCLNIMQATQMCFNEITEESVYKATGHPSPAEVRSIVEIMVSRDYSAAWREVNDMIRTKCLAVVDLVREIHPMVMKMALPDDCKCFCLVRLADVEYNLAVGAAENVSLAAVVGTFHLVKEAAARKVPIASLVPSPL